MPPHCLREIFFIRVLSGRTDFAPTENSRPARKVSRLSGRSRGFGLQTAYFRNGGTFAGGAAAIWGREGILWSVTEKICRTIAGAGLRGVRIGQPDCQIRPRRPVCNRILAVADFGIRILVFGTVFRTKIPKKQKNRPICPDGGRVSRFRFGTLARKHTRGRAGYFHPAQQPANLFLVGNRCFLFRRAFGQAAGGKLDVGGCGRGDDCRCGIRLQR